MISRVASAFVFILVAFTVFAAATVTTTVTVTTTAAPAASTIPASQCNTGDIQCCNSVQSANNLLATTLLGLLGVAISDITALVGITCSPLSIVGIGGNSCSAQPVCCQNNDFNGVIAIGCTPINVNL